MTEVVAALIRSNGRFLICRRPENKARGLLWEFVGGKVEKGESKEEALIRECFEELSIRIEVNDIYFEVTHRYPDIEIHLTLFNAVIVSGEITLNEHAGARWITPDEIEMFDFCSADSEILKKIKSDRNGELL